MLSKIKSLSQKIRRTTVMFFKLKRIRISNSRVKNTQERPHLTDERKTTRLNKGKNLSFEKKKKNIKKL